MTTEVATAPHPAVETDKAHSASATPSHNLSTPLGKSAKASISPSKAVQQSPSTKNVNREDSAHSPESQRSELPKIIVKKEPTSPDPPSRHRPPKLHLGNSGSSAGPRTTSGALNTMRDVGMACLSPGFATHDPAMREQLERSISVRDQQRSIIESRLQRHSKPGDKGGDHGNEPQTARGSRRKPPNSLTIVPPPHRAFANERVVQSAPLNQSFTGRHHHPHAHPVHLPPQNAHQPQVNRLPPIADVFAPERLDSARGPRPVDPQTSRFYQQVPRPEPSPNTAGYPRSREHRSAEEALASMSGGRDDLLPRIIHYGGHQPPTPPSPPQASQNVPSKLTASRVPEHPPHSAGRRRTRAEYEEDSYGPDARASPESKKRKKEEFLALCARAWELFHS